jgi:hypothetical protein
MAVYKVPQDVEAEDKFLGPLTFKQFLFMGGAAICGYLIFISYTKSWWPVVAIVLPFFVGFAALAFPWSKDQPTELWLASRIRFMLMPRVRIWDQTGIKELVEITVPKRPVHLYSDGLSEDQVRNRLNALATVVDTRGWAVKNLAPLDQLTADSDRLVAPHKQDELNERAQIVNNTTDVLDENSSPIAEQFSSLISKSTKVHHDLVIENMRSAQTASSPAQKPSLPPTPTVTTGTIPPAITPAPTTTAEEKALLDEIHRKQQVENDVNQYGRMSSVQPLSNTAQQPPMVHQDQSTSTTPVDPAILALAQNDDLSVLTLGHQANKSKPDEPQEVTVSLH